MTNFKKKEWWHNVFDDKYLKTYADTITAERTAQEIKFLLKNLKLEKRAKILDLACGYGRHSLELAKRGYLITGVDYSKYFIELAKREARKSKIKVDFIHKDIRKINYFNKFDAVISMFTSFGYFDDENDNFIVLKKIAKSLKPGGKFIIEINNAVWMLASFLLKGRKDKKTGFLSTSQINKLSNSLVVKTLHEFNHQTMRWSMTRTWKEKNKLRSYKTDVRLYFLPELKHLMEENNLKVKKVWGNFNGLGFQYDSPRLIILAEKR